MKRTRLPYSLSCVGVDQDWCCIYVAVLGGRKYVAF